MDDKGINFPTFKERPERVDIDLDILNDTIEYIRPAVQADGGDIKFRETITPGFENAPQGLRDVLSGKNFGKQIIKII